MNWRAFQSVFKKFVSNSINDGNSGVVDISKYKNNNVHIHNWIENVYSNSIELRGPFWEHYGVFNYLTTFTNINIEISTWSVEVYTSTEELSNWVNLEIFIIEL